MDSNLIIQIAIVLIGMPALYLATSGKKLGPILAICGAPLWIWSAVIHEQYGMIVCEVVYMFIWIRALKIMLQKNAFERRNLADASNVMHEGSTPSGGS